ncbi:hypothetical protein FPK66_21890, partial [Acinetobacter baumannii]|nr:hypothetical protein [Acinetobacter baumannii]
RQEGDNYYKAHTGANPHRPTRLKDAEEAELLVHNKPDWVDVGVTEKYPGLKQASAEQKSLMRLEKDKEGWPALSEDNIKSFHQMRYVELPQNEKLYRVL